MTMNPTRTLRLALAGALLAASPTAVAEETPRKAVVHLKHFTDDLHAAKMALSFANEFQRQGARTILVLSLEGVRLADRNQPINMTWGPQNVSMSKGGVHPQVETLEILWSRFVGSGGTVLACPGCSAAAGCELKDLRQGAQIGSMERMAKVLLDANVVLDY